MSCTERLQDVELALQRVLSWYNAGYGCPSKKTRMSQSIHRQFYNFFELFFNTRLPMGSSTSPGNYATLKTLIATVVQSLFDPGSEFANVLKGVDICKGAHLLGVLQCFGRIHRNKCPERILWAVGRPRPDGNTLSTSRGYIWRTIDQWA